MVLDGRRAWACVRPIAMGVHLDNGGAVINLTTIADNKITGIEAINITGSTNNTLTLGLQNIEAMSDTTTP